MTFRVCEAPPATCRSKTEKTSCNEIVPPRRICHSPGFCMPLCSTSSSLAHAKTHIKSVVQPHRHPPAPARATLHDQPGCHLCRRSLWPREARESRYRGGWTSSVDCRELCTDRASSSGRPASDCQSCIDESGRGQPPAGESDAPNEMSMPNFKCIKFVICKNTIKEFKNSSSTVTQTQWQSSRIAHGPCSSTVPDASKPPPLRQALLWESQL